MSALDRVFLTTIQALDYATSAGSLPYVPESRALAAEQERDYLTLCLGEANASKEAAHEEVAALREQVRVLTPLARLGLWVIRWGREHLGRIEPTLDAIDLLAMAEQHGLTRGFEAVDTDLTTAARRIMEGGTDG